MTAIALVAGLTLFLSFLCSTLEATLYSVTPSQLEVMRRNKVIGARRFMRFREQIEEPIAAILTVNTISNTLGATLCGALVAEHFGNAATGIFAALFTLAVLAIAEILPKSLGVRFGPSLIPYLAWPLQVIVWVSWPIARPARHVMSKLTRRKDGAPQGPTEDEIIAMSRMAARGGELTPLEMAWVENALGLDKVSAHDLMTPRTVVQTIAIERTVDEILGDPLRPMMHSRLPAYEGDDPDRLVGVVHRRDIYDALVSGRGNSTLREIVRPLDYVPEGMKGPQLLDKFIRGKRHMVAVIDEYGGFEGIVTLEDVLECLIGTEIVDEHDVVVDMQELARRRAARLAKRQAEGGDPVAERG